MKYFLILVCSCLLLSCGGRKVPKGIIPPGQMQTILWQLMQTDEFTATAFTSDTTKNLNTERIRRYRQVFQLNQTTKEAFTKSYDYYMVHPDVAKELFDTLNARAIRLRDTAAAPPHTSPPGQGAKPIVPGASPFPGVNKLNLKVKPLPK